MDEAARRVLVIDGSAVARAVTVHAVEALPGYVVAASLGTIEQALRWLSEHRSDLVLLDIDGKGVSRLTALPAIAGLARGAPIVVVAASCTEGSAAAAQAIAMGASATVAKPATPGTGGRFDQLLADRIGGVMQRPAVANPHGTTGPAIPFDLIAIGASTGGIHAIGPLLRNIAQVQAPILITQHLPGSFTRFFADQISILGARPVDIAHDHLRIRPGRIIVAPGDAHLRVVSITGGAAVRLSRAPQANGCLPSVDPMFDSAAHVYGDRMIAIVLSGMGRDGTEGARSVARAGGIVAAQDQASSVVWGMPGAVSAAGLAGFVGTPEQIGAFIQKGRRVA